MQDQYSQRTGEYDGAKRPTKSSRPVGPVIRKRICDEHGTLVAVHCRQNYHDGTKKIWWELPDGTLGLNGHKPEGLPLYGIHQLNGALQVIIVEGEKARDALQPLLEPLGITVVGTVTGAAP